MLPMTVFDSAERLMVVVAHPDDETFGCGSLLLRAAEAGVTTAVCCATLGDAGEWPADLALGADGLAGQRERELYAAADHLGVSRVDVLGFGDSGMSGDAGPTTVVGADPEAVADRVRDSMAAFRPDVVVTLDGSDGHRDHLRVRDVVLSVADEAGVPVYLYCLARRLMARWATVMTELDPGSSYLALGELGTPDEEIDLVLDTSEFYERREQAIALHRSQTSPFELLPQDLRREWLTTEHLAGPVEGH
jgi:LmbE family N-acetylglucosaminyl deacetylase